MRAIQRNSAAARLAVGVVMASGVWSLVGCERGEESTGAGPGAPTSGPSKQELLREMVTNATNLAERGQYDVAIRQLEEALKAQESTEELLNAIGIVRARQGQFEAAAALFRQALEAKPDFHPARSNLGYALAELGQDEEAERLLREVLAGHPDDGNTLQRLGLLYKKQGKLSDALALLKRALELNPASLTTRFHYADILALTGKTEQALEQLRTVARRNPFGASAVYRLDLLLRRSDAAAADAELNEIFAASGKRAEFFVGLASVAVQEQDYGTADRYLRRGAERLPNNALLANAFAWFLATCPDESCHDGPQAVQWARKACDLTPDPDPSFVDTLAVAQARAGRFDEAVKTAQEAIRLATEVDQPEAAERFKQRLALFEAGQAYAETE